MSVEESRLKISFPEVRFRQLRKKIKTADTSKKEKQIYLLRNCLIIGFSHDRVFLKDVMNKLRGNNNFNVSACDGFRARINELARSTTLLGFLRSLCK